MNRIKKTTLDEIKDIISERKTPISHQEFISAVKEHINKPEIKKSIKQYHDIDITDETVFKIESSKLGIHDRESFFNFELKIEDKTIWVQILAAEIVGYDVVYGDPSE